MVYCSVLGCKSHSDKKENVTFHRFPSDIGLRTIWKASTGRQNWEPTTKSRVCSKHFADDYILPTQSSNLERAAIPSLFINNIPVSKVKREPKALQNDNSPSSNIKENEIDTEVLSLTGQNDYDELPIDIKEEEILPHNEHAYAKQNTGQLGNIIPIRPLLPNYEQSQKRPNYPVLVVEPLRSTLSQESVDCQVSRNPTPEQYETGSGSNTDSVSESDTLSETEYTNKLNECSARVKNTMQQQRKRPSMKVEIAKLSRHLKRKTRVAKDRGMKIAALTSKIRRLEKKHDELTAFVQKLISRGLLNHRLQINRLKIVT